jgi:HK97 family phage portal protein
MPNFITRFLSKFAKTESVDLHDRRLLEWLGVEPDDFNARGKNALRESTVYACIRILSGSVGKLPVKIYQTTGQGKKNTEHYLNYILKVRPNEYMSALDFFKYLETQRNIYGNAYAVIDYHRRGPDKGKVRALYPIDAEKVTIYIDLKGVYNSANRIWYVVSGSNKQFKVRPEEILHLKSMSMDGVQGVSPIHYLRTNIESAAYGSDYINKFYKNGMTTKGIVHYVGDLNKDAEDVFRNKFEQMSNGLKNAHRISLLPYGYQFQPIKMNLTDAQFIDNHKMSIRQIASAFGVKNHQLNDLDRATHTNISEQQREYYIDTLMEILTGYEQELMHKLFTPGEINAGFYLRFNVDAITRADIKTRYEANRIGVQGGFITPNEAREYEDLEPMDGGDYLYSNGSFIRLVDINKGG